MKFLVLLWILMKSTCTSFAGMASMPEVRAELVDDRHWVTDDQVDASVVIARTTPGPVGVYIVALGYMADGVPGAIAGWIAMTAPALVAIALVGYLGRRARHRRVRNMLQCVVLASAVLLVLAAIPIGQDALTTPVLAAIAIVALPVLVTKRLATHWVVVAAAATSLVASLLGVAVR